MNVRPRYDSWLARFFGASAITLYPFIFFATPKERTNIVTVQHEFVHVRQVRALGWWKFYALYLWEYLKLRAGGSTHNGAYLEISYERQAYERQMTDELNAAEKKEMA